MNNIVKLLNLILMKMLLIFYDVIDECEYFSRVIEKKIDKSLAIKSNICCVSEKQF